MIVTNTILPDYVFRPGYRLPSEFICPDGRTLWLIAFGRIRLRRLTSE